MLPVVRKLTPTLYSWASELDEVTLAQAEALSRLPVVAGHVALMPDAHLGKGSTVGSVIPTAGAVIPSAIGVDIGCGMVASRTDRTAGTLPDDLQPFIESLDRVVPAGLGRWHAEPPQEALSWWAQHRRDPGSDLSNKQVKRLLNQLGTMGGGNHFFEIALDQEDRSWIILHSGSRGIGNQLALRHMERARQVCDFDFLSLRGNREDADLAWLEEGTPEFDRYIRDMRFAQAYAFKNRQMMVDAAVEAFGGFVGGIQIGLTVNCHHNFTQLEEHEGRMVWLTRKGAIRAGVGELGLIPGSMGGRSFVVRGLGNTASYLSCAHGAGRRLSRSRARKTLTIESLQAKMVGRAWQRRHAGALLDEHPDAYKDIDRVMADQADLVEPLYELRAIANYKGTS